MIAPALLTAREALPIFLSVRAKVRSRPLRPTYTREVGYNLTRWEKYSGNPPIQAITDATFDDFRAKCPNGPVTVENTVNCVLAILAACVKRGLIDRLPEPGIRLEIPEPRPRVVESEILSKLYVRCDVAHWPGESVPRGQGRGSYSRPFYWAPHFWQVFLVVAYFTGLRLGDLLQLRRSDFAEEVLAVVANKTGKTQSIPVHPVLRRHLGAVTWAGPDELLLPVGKSNHQFRRELKRICKAAGVEHVTPKRIRVLSANEWERARPRAGDAILGHSIRRKVTRYYLRPPLALEEALPRLRVPSAFLTDEEREHGQSRIAELQQLFERMPTDSQELLLGMARRMK